MPESIAPPVKLVNNGTILLTVAESDGDGTKRITLRRPKFHEYRKLREGIRDLNDQVLEFNTEHEHALRALDDELGANRGEEAGIVLDVATTLSSLASIVDRTTESMTPGDRDVHVAKLGATGQWLGELVGVAPSDLPDGDEPGEDRTELMAQLRQRQRVLSTDLTDKIEGARVGWVVDAIELLGGVRLGDDQVEAFMATNQFIDELVKHWQEVPLPSGGG